MYTLNILSQNQKFITVTMLVLSAALLRLVPHPANMTPIAALALFGGCYLNKRLAIVVPLVAMMLSDLFLGFNSSTPFVYLSFVFISFIGMLLAQRRTVLLIVSACLISSLLFFLITNFGFWLSYDLYPKTFSGQFEAYLLALPFLRNTLFGDLFYTAVLFGGYALVQKYGKKSLYDKNIYQNRG